ncbi:hypothetical protein [Nostoc sp.]|uniref:hypothetical protein n=1 Tax=Nostoc sp. TaxID=1180 RepID=UPI002FFC89D0
MKISLSGIRVRILVAMANCQGEVGMAIAHRTDEAEAGNRHEVIYSYPFEFIPILVNEF